MIHVHYPSLLRSWHKQEAIGGIFSRLESRSYSDSTRQIAPPTKNSYALLPVECPMKCVCINEEMTIYKTNYPTNTLSTLSHVYECGQ